MNNEHGAEPENVKPHNAEAADKVDQKKKKTDVTGQTDTTVKEMKARLNEVPHTSAATHHDKHAYEKKHKAKEKK